ncbi:MAG: hypothetical protein Fur0012_04280 [Elusimicrobiota bacterium]
MVKKISAVLGLLVSASFLSAEVNFDSGKPVNLQGEIEKISVGIPVPEMAVERGSSKADKDWTIMVYINNKNNLQRYGIKDVNEMEMVGSTDKVNIVVELGAGPDSTSYSFKGTKRYYVTKDDNTSTLSSTMVQNLGKVDMGDYKHLIDFGKWAKSAYPAKKYMLIVWNHGSGWEKSIGDVITKGISYDDESRNHINTPQLGQALKEIGGVDVYGSDACLMGMAEVVYELKDSATYIVGSEETEPGDGYTYNDLLAPLAAKPTMTPSELAKTAVTAYVNHYKAQGEDSTQAYVKTSAIDGFLAAVNEFAYALSQSDDRASVKSAISKAQSYAISDNKDLYHFASLIVNSSSDAAVKEKGQALMTYIKTKLVGANAYSGNYSNSYGIAVYLPTYSIGNGYNELQWAKYSNWDEFIKWYQAQ